MIPDFKWTLNYQKKKYWRLTHVVKALYLKQMILCSFLSSEIFYVKTLLLNMIVNKNLQSGRDRNKNLTLSHFSTSHSLAELTSSLHSQVLPSIPFNPFRWQTINSFEDSLHPHILSLLKHMAMVGAEKVFPWSVWRQKLKAGTYLLYLSVIFSRHYWLQLREKLNKNF